VESSHGKVQYRSIVNAEQTKFEAQAVIKAKKVGTATITLENPKSKNTFSVIVKVYRKGVLGVVPVVVDGAPVYKINLGEKFPIQLQAVSGKIEDLRNITWTVDNEELVNITANNLYGILEGKKSGLTTLRIKAENIKYEYTALLIIGNDDYIDNMSYMYASNPFISVIKGESIQIKLICENMTDNDIKNISIVCNNNNTEIIAYRNNITVRGIETGESEIIAKASGLNEVTIRIRVEDYEINPDMPFYLRSDKMIYGMVKGNSMELPVELVGGGTVNERNILWNVENSNVVKITGNGKTAFLSGNTTGQTVITVRHPKSVNSLEIVIYVVENNDALINSIVMYVKERSVLMERGELRYISIITNANDMQRNGFQWDVSDLNVIDLNISTDRTKAYVFAKEAGSSVITVKNNLGGTPSTIYVSVINDKSKSRDPYINVPSVVEMAKGDVYRIQAITNDAVNKANITWKTKNDDIATVYGNGDSCLVQGLSYGSTLVEVASSETGFIKNILLFVYENASEIGTRYILAGEQSRYVIQKGDVTNISLLFGLRGFPDYEVHNIRWQTTDNTVLQVTGNGKSAFVKGINTGIGIVNVNHGIANTVSIEIEVRDEIKPSDYWFSIKEEEIGRAHV
jgi:hypothetical protein